MIMCPECSARNLNNAINCVDCGFSLSKIDMQAEAAIITQIMMKCRYCGKEIRQDSFACTYCGRALLSTQSTNSQSQESSRQVTQSKPIQDLKFKSPDTEKKPSISTKYSMEDLGQALWKYLRSIKVGIWLIVIAPICCLVPWLMISVFNMATMDHQSVIRGNIINSIFAMGGLFMLILIILKIGDNTATSHQVTQTINASSSSPQPRKDSSSNEQGTKSFTEKDNLGTNVDTHSRGDAYWHTRMVQGPDYPFVIYYFDNEKNAREALLELPCIHVAQDSQRLICTEVLDFGYYPAKNEAYAAFICGKDLTHELWEQAKTSFVKHNGTPRNEQEPEKSSAPVQPATAARPDKVVFVKETSGQNQVGATYIKKRYSAPDAASAKAFLQEHPVTQQFYYIEIDTPEGNFGRDIQGIYTY